MSHSHHSHHDHHGHDHDHSPADQATKQGRELIQATKAFAVENRFYSWFVSLSTFFILLGLMALALSSIHIGLRLGAGLLAGLVLVRLFVIYHDHQHFAILCRSKIAEPFMQMVGILTLAPSSVWKHTHNVHHANNSMLHCGSVGSFPVMTVEKYQASSKLERFGYHVNRHPIVIALGYFTTFLLSMCLLPFLQNPKKHWDGLLALGIHSIIVLTVVLSLGWGALFLGIVLPFSIAACLGTYLFYVQHNFPGVVLKDREGWTFEGAALESSSQLKCSRLFHWFTANIGYHHIHHLNSRIPFYRLPEAYKAIPELQKAKQVRLKPKEILKSLRLKIWSVEEQKLITMREFKSKNLDSPKAAGQVGGFTEA